MKIKYGQRVRKVEDFVYERLLYKEVRGFDERVNLEAQPEVVARAMGRMLNVMLDKGLITLDDFHKIVGTEYDYSVKREAELVPDDTEERR